MEQETYTHEEVKQLTEQLQAEKAALQKQVDLMPESWYTQKGLDAHCELRDRNIERFQNKNKQLQHDLDVEKAKSASFVSALAYCLDETKDLGNKNISSAMEAAFAYVGKLSRIRGHVGTLGECFKIDWDKVKR